MDRTPFFPHQGYISPDFKILNFEAKAVICQSFDSQNNTEIVDTDGTYDL